MHLMCFSIVLIGIVFRKANEVTGASECPQNIQALRHLHVYHDACLVLVRNKLTWKDARASCTKTGGDLVMIKDADKQEFILNALRADHWDQDVVWIGASDLQHEGDWRWVDGSKVTFSRFSDGQGNNHNDGFFFANGGTEDCAVLRRDDGGKWHDYHCESIVGNVGYHFTYICEFRKPAMIYRTTLIPKTTPKSWTTKLPTTDKQTMIPTTTTIPKISSQLMTTRLPTTAQHGTTNTCVDNTFVNCNDPIICTSTRKKTYCPVSCGLCTPITTPKPCLNNPLAKCSSPGICSTHLKSECQSTCGLCAPITTPKPCLNNPLVKCSSPGICSTPLKSECQSTCGLCGTNTPVS